MLTADMAQVRRRGDRLQVMPLTGAARERACELAAAYLDLARDHVGLTRGELADAWRQIDIRSAERRLSLGLCKLITDRCTFDQGAALAPEALRQALFLRASAARHTAEGMDREQVMEAVAAERGISAAEIDRSLYADLPTAHRLASLDALSAEALLSAYDVAQVQAVLLRAVQIRATIAADAPGVYRALFRRLKFLRLLHQIEALEPRGFRLTIDGPFSLFESVTKYGLQLALAFPAIASCAEWEIEADVRWGRQREPLRFSLRGSVPDPTAPASAPLPDEATALLSELETLETPWRARASEAILNLPGVGLCVPDIEFRHADSGLTVYLEVLGFWSRDAVWRRVEMVKKGFGHAIVFAVSKRLRVSEAALEGETPGLLYVYSRVMNARGVLRRVEEAARRVGKDPRGS
jgi:predicted nuclease of restriction endonuclease-like RecB superfamily